MKKIINDENLPFLLELIKRELDPIKAFIDNLKKDHIVLSMFEFPFSNESLEENFIEFGEIVNKKENVIVYEGDEDGQ